MPTWAKMIPYLRIENLKNHTLSRGTYLYSPYMGVTLTPGVAYLLSILWRRARLCLSLFVNAVATFLLRITYLSSYVFLHMVFAERSRTMAYTTSETVNGLTRHQLHLNPVVPERPKEEETYTSSKRNKSSFR